MVAEWFVHSNGESVGPYTQEQVLELVEHGSLLPSSFVRRLDGPWITVADAFFRMLISEANSQSAIEVIAPVQYDVEPLLAIASPPGSSTRYRRKKSSSLNALMTIAAVALGGVAAVYTAKSIRTVISPEAEGDAGATTLVVPRRKSTINVPLVARIRDSDPDPQIPDQADPLEPMAAIEPPPLASIDPLSLPALPKSPKNDVPTNAVDVKPDAVATAWLETLDAIFARRDSLILRMRESQQNLQPLVDQARSIDVECRAKEKRIGSLRQDIVDLSNEIDRLTSLRDVSMDDSLSSTIRSLRSRAESCQSSIRELNTAARRLEYRTAMTTIATLQEQDKVLRREADSLRAEFVWHLNPFAEPSEPIATVALKVFSRPVPGDNAVLRAWNEFGKACIYLRQREAVLAETYFKSALASEPQEATFRALRGYWKLRLNDEDAAFTDLVAAMKDAPANWTVNYLMALYHCRKGSHSAVEIQLRKCRDLDKSNPKALILLSLLKSASNDIDIRNANFAKQFAREALGLKETAAANFAMAAALAESGNFLEAIQHAESAIKSSPVENPDDFYHQSVELFRKDTAVRINWATFDAWNQL